MRAISDKIREETYKSINLGRCAFDNKNKNISHKLRNEQNKAFKKKEWFKKLAKAMKEEK